jgi:hypothetical protein
MFTKIVIIQSALKFTRMRGENSNNGITQLHKTITQYIHPHGPK